MNLQRFDDSTLIRIFALHELHRQKDEFIAAVIIEKRPAR